ncbi:hypothetical protein DFJ73DRAFT_859200 [Zopfochytrium polystomum]|nr:hypothetical protein DFJ73DRAFT_859200 [Zopfochytrium polystomum]
MAADAAYPEFSSVWAIDQYERQSQTPEDKAFVTALRAWYDEARAAHEKRAAELEAERKIQAAEFAAARERDQAEAEAKRALIYLKPYTGGKVRIGSSVWTGGTFSGEGVEVRFDGSNISPVSGIPNYGYWNGESFQWFSNFSSPVNLLWTESSQSFQPKYTQLPMMVSWTWDGTNLVPNSEKFAGRVAHVEGSVPLPLVVFAALSRWLQDLLARVNGTKLCRTHLWPTDVQKHSSICGACCENRNVCTLCTTRHRCVRCNGFGNLRPAFCCDSCGSHFDSKCVKAR